ALRDIREYNALRFQTQSHTGIREDRLLGRQTDNRLRPGVLEVDDYFYERPSNRLDVARNAKDNPKHSRNKLRKYRYPAGHEDSGVGQQLADVLIDAERADSERKYAYGHAPLIHAGGVFTLADHPIGDENARHFAVRARHSVFVQHFRTGPGARDTGYGAPGEIEPDSDQYHGDYEVADAGKEYRTLPTTPW